MIRIFILAICTLMLSTQLTASPLKKGQFKASMSFSNNEIRKIKVSNSDDDSSWKATKVDDIKMSDFDFFTYINDEVIPTLNSNINALDLDTTLIDSWKRDSVNFEFAYGLSDKLRVFVKGGYEKATLDYSDAFEEQSELADLALTGLYTLEGSDKRYYRVPDKARSNDLKDSYVGLKYAINPKWKVALSHSSGILKTGQDASEVSIRDDYQELQTSNGSDKTHLFLYTKQQLLGKTITIKTAYSTFGEGVENFLDNQNIKTKPGDVITISASTRLHINEAFTISPKLSTAIHQKDQYKGGNSNSITADTGHENWTNVPGSEGSITQAHLRLNYQFTPEFTPFAAVSYTLNNSLGGRLYSGPERISSVYSFQYGVTFTP